MSLLVETETRLGYLINDADEHSTPPTTAYQDYIDPDKRHLAITEIRRDNGRHEMIWGGKPDPSPVRSYGHEQVTSSTELMAELGLDDQGPRGSRDVERTHTRAHSSTGSIR